MIVISFLTTKINYCKNFQNKNKKRGNFLIIIPKRFFRRLIFTAVVNLKPDRVSRMKIKIIKMCILNCIHFIVQSMESSRNWKMHFLYFLSFYFCLLFGKMLEWIIVVVFLLVFSFHSLTVLCIFLLKRYLTRPEK